MISGKKHEKPIFVIPDGRLIGSQREPLRKLGEAERPDLNKRLPEEVDRKSEL